MAGLYIHIPFCASRCIYCGFYSTVLPSLQDRYINAVCEEMRIKRSMQTELVKIETIYIGGGTPSQLSSHNFRKIFNTINNLWGVCEREVTVECNPDDVTLEMGKCLMSLGVNRISMGAQTFSNDRLRFLHRRHTANEVEQAINIFRTVGFNNISVDLMFGFPDETLDEWLFDIAKIISLEVEHISAYSLMYEEGTPLYQLLKQGKIHEIDELLSLQMYSALIDRLSEVGYEHYEISNFARHGFKSKHNSSYWHQIPYIGIGASAHSYDLISRQWNVADIHQYISAIELGNIPCKREILDEDTRYNDLITTALRTREGILIEELTPIYREYLMDNAKKFIDQEMLKMDLGHLHLTRSGLFISDLIMSELMKV